MKEAGGALSDESKKREGRADQMEGQPERRAQVAWAAVLSIRPIEDQR